MGISGDDGGNGDGSTERNTLVGAEVMVVVVIGLIGLSRLPVECLSWESPPGSPVPHVGCALAGGRTQWGLLDSPFLLTSSEHSLLGNEMQIDRKDNEPACGP